MVGGNVPLKVIPEVIVPAANVNGLPWGQFVAEVKAAVNSFPNPVFEEHPDEFIETQVYDETGNIVARPIVKGFLIIGSIRTDPIEVI